MAILPYEDDEEEQLRQAAAGGAVGAPAPNYAPTQSTNPAGASRFINFGQYFNANKGFAEASAGNLASSLSSSADAAQNAATAGQASLTDKAQKNTVQGPMPEVATPAAAAAPSVIKSPDRQYEQKPVAPKSPDRIYEQKPAQQAATAGAGKYAGPTQDDVTSLFAPLESQARDVGNKLNQTVDAPGVKALQGGTGFGATLTNAAGAGTLAGLRQKYGGLGTAMTDARTAATGAVNTAQQTSKDNLAAWQARSATIAAQEAAQREAAIQADLTKAKGAAYTQPAKDAAARTKAHAGISDSTRTLTEEDMALRYGLTLEEYIRAGRPDLSKATPADIKSWKGAR